MATNLAVSTGFGTLSTYVYPTGYDPTKLGLGPLMLQVNDAGNEGKWVGPIPTNVTRPVENAVALGMIYPDSVNITSASNNNRYDWVLTTDSTVAAAATRKFQLFQFDRQARQNAWSSFGTITATPPGGGIGVSTYVVQGERLVYAQYTSANNSTTPSTVAINNGSPTLTGTSTSWQTDRMYIGSRIGIGTTDPAAVTQWYYISAISSDTSITLTSNYQGTNTSGQPYIIEDLRILFVATGTVAANSGLYMVAGISLNDFNTASSVIPAASAADKAKATYWLGDGGSGSNTAIQVPGGIAIDARTSWINQYVYCINNPALISQFQVNNFRGANNANTTLTFVNGRDAAGPGAGASWVLNTGQQAVTGAVSKTHNLVLVTPGAGGGPRALKKTLFWVTVSRLYSAEVANIISASTTFQSGAAIEMPPGTTTTYAATGALASLVYSSVLDRFVVFSSGAAATHSYITQYREDAGQWDRIFLTDTKQLNQTTADPTAAVFPITSTLAVTGDIMNGNLYLTTTGTTAATNFLYNLPLADWEYAGLSGNGAVSNCCVVTPAMSTSQFASFVAGYLNVVGVIGGPMNPTLGRTGTNLGSEPGAVRLWYRTNVGSAGVVDNGGTWNLLDYSGNMSQVPAASQIQGRIEFRIFNSCFPPRVTRVCFEGSGSPSVNNFQFSQGKTVLANKQFAFRQSVAFGTNTTLYMRIYDAITNNLLVSDNTAASTGTWEYSTDGSTWYVFSSTGSGATVTFTVSGSSINAVTTTPVAGGTGYPASATLRLLVTGGGGTGGIISATTNGSGVITGFGASPIAVGTGYSGTTGAATSADCPWSTVWDFTNQTTYLRYTPISIADSIDVTPVVSIS